MNILEIKNVRKTFAEADNLIHAVNGVNLTIEKGEFTAIVGPSGSGKTTLLNLIGGLDKPTEGEIIIDGVNICKLKPSQLIDFRLHNIGFVFQAYNLIPVLTAKENTEFIMFLQGIKPAIREKRSSELLTAVGLGERLHSRPNKLSGGQQQRVAVARALASNPKFVLADEPTANLDSKAAERLLEIMEKLNHEKGITFIFSTHDQRVVSKAHRVIVLQDGKIEKDYKQNV